MLDFTATRFSQPAYKRLCDATATIAKNQHDEMHARLRAAGVVPEGSEVFRKKYGSGTQSVLEAYSHMCQGIGVEELTREHQYGAGFEWLQIDFATRSAGWSPSKTSKEIGYATAYQAADRAKMEALAVDDPRRVAWQRVRDYAQGGHQARDAAVAAAPYRALPPAIVLDPDAVLADLLAQVADPEHPSVRELQLLCSALIPVHVHKVESERVMEIPYANRDGKSDFRGSTARASTSTMSRPASCACTSASATTSRTACPPSPSWCCSSRALSAST